MEFFSACGRSQPRPSLYQSIPRYRLGSCKAEPKVNKLMKGVTYAESESRSHSEFTTCRETTHEWLWRSVETGTEDRFGSGQLIFVVQRQVLRNIRIKMFEFCEQAGVGEIEAMGVIPVVVGDLVQTVHDLRVADFYGKFTAAVKTARGEVDRTNDRARAIGIEQLGMQLEVFQLMNFDPNIVHDSKPAHRFCELLTL